MVWTACISTSLEQLGANARELFDATSHYSNSNNKFNNKFNKFNDNDFENILVTLGSFVIHFLLSPSSSVSVLNWIGLLPFPDSVMP